MCKIWKRTLLLIFIIHIFIDISSTSEYWAWAHPMNEFLDLYSLLYSILYCEKATLWTRGIFMYWKSRCICDKLISFGRRWLCTVYIRGSHVVKNNSIYELIEICEYLSLKFKHSNAQGMCVDFDELIFAGMKTSCKGSLERHHQFAVFEEYYVLWSWDTSLVLRKAALHSPYPDVTEIWLFELFSVSAPCSSFRRSPGAFPHTTVSLICRTLH